MLYKSMLYLQSSLSYRAEVHVSYFCSSSAVSTSGGHMLILGSFTHRVLHLELAKQNQFSSQGFFGSLQQAPRLIISGFTRGELS